MSCRRQPVRVTLRIEVRNREGKLIDVREKVSDLILDNFRDIIAEVLYPLITTTATGWRSAAVVDIGGTSRSLAVFSSADDRDMGEAGNFLHRSYSSFDVGVRIAIGTSTVAPSRGDYKLGAEVARGTPTQTVGADYISWAISLTLTAAADIAEAGLMLRCIVAGWGVTPTFGDILLFRDTFTPVSVPAGGTISVTYTLTL